jgi:hypothetical protein
LKSVWRLYARELEGLAMNFLRNTSAMSDAATAVIIALVPVFGYLLFLIVTTFTRSGN